LSQKVVFIARVSKQGESYIVRIPAKYREQVAQLYRRYVRVILEPLE